MTTSPLGTRGGHVDGADPGDVAVPLDTLLSDAARLSRRCNAPRSMIHLPFTSDR